MAIQPIRLFGDPVLRTPAEAVKDFDKELRVLVKDLSETMLDAPGAGLAAPQIGVSLRVFTYHVDDVLGHLINPTLDLSEEQQDGDEGCLSVPGLTFDTRRAFSVVAQGWNMHARHGRGHRAAGPLRAARDRPPRRRPVHRPARPRGAQGGLEGDPRGRVVRREPARDQAQPARHLRLSPLGAASFRATGLRRYARDGRPGHRGGARLEPRAGRGDHASRRALGAWPLARRLARRRGRRRPGHRAAAADEPPRSCLPRPPGRARARLLPGGGVRSAGAAGRARDPRARLGQPALLAAPGLARRGPGAARDPAR